MPAEPKILFTARLGEFFLICAILLAGCTSTDNTPNRTEHLSELRDKFQKISSGLRPENGKLTLERGIEIALENNLDIQIAELSHRLAGLDSDAAFSAFLPQVQFGVSRVGTDRPRKVGTGGGYAQMSDQHILQAALSAQQVVFTPQAWFIYRMHRKGEKISELLTQRVRQQIRLRVTAEYYACLTLKAHLENIEAEIRETVQLLSETKAKEREGLILTADRMEVENLLLRQTNRKRTLKRDFRLARAELFTTLGVSPLFDVELIRPPPVKIEIPGLVDAVYRALQNRIELHTADRGIEIAEANVKRALAAFLPNIGFTTTLSRSTDSYLKYPGVWEYGLHGILTAFDGFRNVAAYKAAKVKRKQAFLRREQQCFSIILQTGTALGILKDAEENLDLTASALALADKRLEEGEARKREGLIENSDCLRALTTRSKARSSAGIAQCRLAVAHASLQDTIGQAK